MTERAGENDGGRKYVGPEVRRARRVEVGGCSFCRADAHHQTVTVVRSRAPMGLEVRICDRCRAKIRKGAP